MDYLQLIDSLTPEIYQSLLRSVAVGKWPDGNALTAAQRANAMQAIIAWGERHLAEPDRVGYIAKKPVVDDRCDLPVETPLAWKE
jgi:uncharacterized protein